MTERERLVELLEKWDKQDEVDSIADYLLANGVIVPPVKVGQFIYYKDNGEIYKDRVIGVVYSEDLDYTTKSVRTFDCLLAWDNLGETYFATQEEAERELERRKQ